MNKLSYSTDLKEIASWAKEKIVKIMKAMCCLREGKEEGEYHFFL